MFKFTGNTEEYFKRLLNTEEITVFKSNPQSVQCWNVSHCEVEIEDEEGGRLVLKISISEKSTHEIEGDIEEVWYWDEEFRPEPAVNLFLGADRKIKLVFENEDDMELTMKSYYGRNIL